MSFVLLSSIRALHHVSYNSKRGVSTISNDLFEYTSGRFLFNEYLRLAERQTKFNVSALLSEICRITNRPKSDLVQFQKTAEGGFNRVFQATFIDGQAILARLPYPSTAPPHYAVASEVATLGLLKEAGSPVPRVLGYSCEAVNEVGSEYMLLEKLPGSKLGDRWYSLEPRNRAIVMRQVVELEACWLKLKFQASGSVYYKEDLDNGESCVEIPGYDGRFVVGLSTAETWWSLGREKLDVDRGPWTKFNTCFQAPAKRELAFCQDHARPRHHVERQLRQLHEFKLQDPLAYTATLTEFLKVAPHLEIPASHPFSRPILRHPDLSPNNILVSDSNEITGIIDWQHAVIQPLALYSSIPPYFANWGDPFSEAMRQPETVLPKNIETLDPSEQENSREQFHQRLVHFYYVAVTLRNTRDLYSAIRDHNTNLLRTLFDRTNVPWEGDSTSLKYALLQILEDWPFCLGGENPTKLGLGAEIDVNSHESASAECPVNYTDAEKKACLDLHFEERDYLNDVAEMREVLGIDSVGWLPDDERLNAAKSLRAEIKSVMLNASETEMEKMAITEHFPFDDHDESEGD